MTVYVISTSSDHNFLFSTKPDCNAQQQLLLTIVGETGCVLLDLASET